MKKFNSYEEFPEELKQLADRYFLEDQENALQEMRESGYIVETNGMNCIEWVGVNETAEEIFTGLNVTTEFINMNWRIKVSGGKNGERLNTLVGVSGLINLVGVDLTNRLFQRAERGNGDKVVCKLRRGLRVTFYSK